MKQSLTTNYQAFIVFCLMNSKLILQAADQRGPRRMCAVCEGTGRPCQAGLVRPVQCGYGEGICLTVLEFNGKVLEGRITCVQCTPSNPRCESGNVEATPCEDSHNFCAMYRVFIGGSQGVFRGCSHQWLRGCRRKMIEGLDAMICYHSCSWNGCNAGYNSLVSYLL